MIAHPGHRAHLFSLQPTEAVNLTDERLAVPSPKDPLIPTQGGTSVQVNSSSSYNMDTKTKGSFCTTGSEDFISQYFDNLHLSFTEIKKKKGSPCDQKAGNLEQAALCNVQDTQTHTFSIHSKSRNGPFQ